MIEKTAWDVRKYPEKFAVYRILCNFAVVFQNCINSMEAKYIHRELSAVIEEAYRYFSVITVTGPRQSGKTTLLRNLFSYLPYYSLENLDVRSFAENDCSYQFRRKRFKRIRIEHSCLRCYRRY